MEKAVRPLSEIPAINRFLSYCRVRTVPAKTVMIACLAATPVLFVLGGLSSPSLDRAFAYLAWATIAVGVVIFQRRRMFSDLRRED